MKSTSSKTQAQFTTLGTPLSITNLRRHNRDRNVFVPVGEPRQVSDSGALPAAEFTIAGSRVLFWVDGKQIWVETCAGAADSTENLQYHHQANRRLLGTLAAAPLMLQHTAQGVIRVLLKGAPPAYITYDSPSTSSFTLAGQVPDFPGVTISTTAVETLRGVIPARNLGSVNGHAPGPLGSADTLTMLKAGIDGYRSLGAMARRTGRFLQPVLARYRIVDNAGDTLATGPWVMPSAALGFQCTGQLNVPLNAETGQTTQGAIEAQSYLLAVSATEEISGPWQKLAAKLIIEVSDEIDPVDTDTEPVGSEATVTADPHGIMSVRWYLPGCSARALSDPSLHTPLLTRAIASTATRVRVAAEIDHPFEGKEATVVGATHNAPSTVATTSPLLCTGFSALLETGNLILGADPAAVNPAAAAPKSYAIDPEATTLSPVLTVPDSRATRISVTYTDKTGATHIRHYPLTPHAATGSAYWLSPTLQPPFSGATAITAVSVTTADAPSEQGTIVCMQATAPHTELTRCRCSPHAVAALTHIPRGDNGWDFSRHRILVFTRGGIWQLTITANGTTTGTALIDTRGVTHHSAVTWGLGSDGAPCVFASAGGDLVAITGRRSRTIIHNLQASALGWCGRHAELLMATPHGLQRLSTDTELTNVLSDLFPGGKVSFARWQGNLLLSADGALYNADSEGSPQQTRCRLHSRVAAPATHTTAKPLWLECRLYAAEATGTITLGGDNGAATAAPLIKTGLHGAI
ncbi:MAG: hypothetical protein K2O10_07780, partial [Muribaculaceae bacterium]|nr:hypothetical protein [Muribaculaceae bacterium]